MFARVYSAQPLYLSAAPITVEADLSRGLHSFSIVGLPDKAIEEARDRVSAAIKHSGFPSPKSQNRKVVISLAPADIKKEGPAFDLPIALAYLLASGDIAFDPSNLLFIGELSLDGAVRPVRGVLAAVKNARDRGMRAVFVPQENAGEAALVRDITIYGIQNLREVICHLDTKSKEKVLLTPQDPTEIIPSAIRAAVDLGDIRGQETAKRGLEIAAAGRHNIALYGPPGTGKTMLARALQSLLPPLSFEEMLEVTAIHSIAGTLSGKPEFNPPFRSPHHSASYVSLVGGGANVRPGEVTLAHRGVLFLDEFPEFDRRAIDALREPLEEGKISVARAKGTALFPANFILIAAMNPTRAHGGTGAEALRERERFQRKISGPIADRIDMWIEVPHVPHASLATPAGNGESEAARVRIKNARDLQRKRFATDKTNGDMTVNDIGAEIKLNKSTQILLTDSAKRLDLSPRAYHRIIKLARTIADLDESADIGEPHVLEALQYRPKDLFS
jgi:magnesium chelatase family protein